MSEFPTALQLELMEEDNMAFGTDDLPPDEQQLEVLEDIWLKAGEIEAEDAMICDAGYNVKKNRKYFQKKKRNRDPNRPRKDKKKRDDDPSKSRKEDGSTDELTGLYTPCDSKSKKVCGKIVAPIDLDKQNLDTAELVKSLVAQETDMLLSHKKKHKHKEKDHEHKKHKKRKHHSSNASSVSDTESVKTEKSSPEVKEEIDSIIRAAAEEHEQSLLQSSNAASAPVPKFEILPNDPPSVSQSNTATLKLFRRPKETKILKSKVQTIKTSKGIITVLEHNPMLSKPKEPAPVVTVTSKQGSTLYENAFLSFLSSQQVQQEDTKKKTVRGKVPSKPAPQKGRPTAAVESTVNFASANLPSDIRVSPVVAKDASASKTAPGNSTLSPTPPKDVKGVPVPKEVESSSTNFSEPFAAAFDSMHTITTVGKGVEIEAGTTMPQLSVPEPKDPHVEHEQMPMLDAHSPVTQLRTEQNVGVGQAVVPTVTSVAAQPSPIPDFIPVEDIIPVAKASPLTNSQRPVSVYNVKTVQPANVADRVEQQSPQTVATPVPGLKHKPNLIWSNHKYYTVNQCQETSYLNDDRFYPMTNAPIKLEETLEQKVVVETIPADLNEGFTALKEEYGDDLEGRDSGGENTEDSEGDSSSSCSSGSTSDSSSDSSDSEEEDCKLQLSSDESRYSPDDSDFSDTSSDDGDDDYKCHVSLAKTKKPDYQDTTQNEMKENVNSNSNKRPLNGADDAPAKKRKRKATFLKRSNVKSRPGYSYGTGKYVRKQTQPTRKVIRPYLSEIILGVRKKGRPTKEVQHKFNAIRGIINDFRNRYNMKAAKGRRPADPNAPLSKYLAYKKASLTPLDCRVQVQDVLSHFSRDIQDYLKSGLTLFNVSSIPIAQSDPASDPEDDPKEQCSKSSSKQPDQKTEHAIEHGDVVWAKHKNGRYYKAIVMKIRTKPKMCVFFPEDQSFSKDIILSDIVDWQKIKKPTIGQRLQIRWVDGKVYDADYIGKVDYSFYTVLFEDESTSHLYRDYIYALNEYIPKRIQSKLSYASDMKNRDYLYDQESPLPEKRPVKRKLYEEEEK